MKLLLVALLLGAAPVPKTKDIEYTTQVTVEYGTGDAFTVWYLHSTDGYRLGVDEERFKKYKDGGIYTSPWWEKDRGF